jgi:hypothetical protein
MEYLPIETEEEDNCSRGLRLFIEQLLLFLSHSCGETRKAEESVIEF